MSYDYVFFEKITQYEYFLLLGLSLLGVLTIVQSNDLITLYLAIELQSLAFYVLASFKVYSNFSTEAGLKYFILGAFSSGILLLGSSLVYGFTGTKPSAENENSVYPNPFNEKLQINYTLKTSGHIKIVMFNSIGNEIAIVEDNDKTAGSHKSVFEGKYLAVGMYYCKIFSGDNVQIIKVIKNK